MINDEIFSKIKIIFSQILRCKESEIREDTKAEDIDEWDSLTHINLVLEIEKKFNIRFALGELHDLKNVKDLVKLVESKK